MAILLYYDIYKQFLVEIIQCSKKITISNGFFPNTTTQLGSDAILHCFEGYSITGNRRYTCGTSGNSGVWQGTGRCGMTNDALPILVMILVRHQMYRCQKVAQYL